MELNKDNNRLGVLIIGCGAVTTTLLAGIESIKKGFTKPIGSLSQLGKYPDTNEFISNKLNLTPLENLEFLVWDIFSDNAYESAKHHEVIDTPDLTELQGFLSSIKPLPGVFNSKFVTRLNGTHIKPFKTHQKNIDALFEDIDKFQKEKKIDKLVMVWAASTEIFIGDLDFHKDLKSFEKALESNHESIPPSQIYAYVALKQGIPFINGSPNLTIDIPAMQELANSTKTPLIGKDFKSGQTFIKTILAPGLKARLLGLEGWFSSNILGNRDGEVLDDPNSFKTKEVSKLSVLDSILEPDIYPELYNNYFHKVRINYYPPRKDNKESWDNIDIIGWMNYKMQIKINFLCRDSILAAPLMLDLILFAELAKKNNLYGIQEWLSLYFKSPQTIKHRKPIHDLFVQSDIFFKKLKELK